MATSKLRNRKRIASETSVSIVNDHQSKRRKTCPHYDDNNENQSRMDTIHSCPQTCDPSPQTVGELKKLRVIDLKDKMKQLNMKCQSQWRKTDLIHKIQIYYANKELNEESETSGNKEEEIPHVVNQSKPKKRVTFNLTPIIFGATNHQSKAIANKSIPERDYSVTATNSVSFKRYAKRKTVCISSGDEGVLQGWIAEVQSDKILVKWKDEQTHNIKQKWYQKSDKSIWLKR
eukprot:206475_1